MRLNTNLLIEPLAHAPFWEHLDAFFSNTFSLKMQSGMVLMLVVLSLVVDAISGVHSWQSNDALLEEEQVEAGNYTRINTIFTSLIGQNVEKGPQ